MSSESLSQIACRWVDMGSFHMRSDEVLNLYSVSPEYFGLPLLTHSSQ
jgi:hypothetical protein